MSIPHTSQILAGSLALATCLPNVSETSDYIDTPTMGTTSTNEPTTTTTTTTTHETMSVTTLDTSSDDTVDDTTEADTSTTMSTQCGNGIPEIGEECDDGNKVDTDDCLNTCTVAKCGDKIIWDGVEGCDDGNEVDTDDCLNACTIATCSDNVIWEGVEGCDDGNKVDTDDCLNTCTTAQCGDNVVQDGVEECDGSEDCLDCFSPRRVFITSAMTEKYKGNLGTVAGADKICKDLARAHQLPGADADVPIGQEKYMAWITGSDVESAPAMRFNAKNFGGWYVSAKNSTHIAQGWNGLTTKPLLSAIIEDETGSVVSNLDTNVWSNTNALGERVDAVNHCDNWMDSSGGGQQGNKGRANKQSVDVTWTHTGKTDCNSNNRLYCFQTGP